MISLDDFVDDRPWAASEPECAAVRIADRMDGFDLCQLEPVAGGRGNLVVMLSDRHGPRYHTPHASMITAAPRSVRARVIDKNQHDRLALARGSVRVVRHGIRPESPTDGRLAGIDAGAANTVHPTILLSVVHGAQTLVEEEALFVTLPTRAHDTARPDTARLPVDHPGTACRFE